MASIGFDELKLLAVSMSSIDELKHILDKMLTNLTEHFRGDERKARRLLLESVAGWPDVQAAFKALLPPAKEGRPKGDRGRVAFKDVQLLSFAKIIQNQRPRARVSDPEIARKYLRVIKGKKRFDNKEVTNTAKALGRARKRRSQNPH